MKKAGDLKTKDGILEIKTSMWAITGKQYWRCGMN